MSRLRKLALQLLSLYLGLFVGGLAKSATPATQVDPAKPDGARWSVDHRGAPSLINRLAAPGGQTAPLAATGQPPLTETTAPSCPVGRSMLSVLAGRDLSSCVLGDLAEEYSTVVLPQLGRERAEHWYRDQIVRSAASLDWARLTRVIPFYRA